MVPATKDEPSHCTRCDHTIGEKIKDNKIYIIIGAISIIGGASIIIIFIRKKR